MSSVDFFKLNVVLFSTLGVDLVSVSIVGLVVASIVCLVIGCLVAGSVGLVADSVDFVSLGSNVSFSSVFVRSPISISGFT